LAIEIAEDTVKKIVVAAITVVGLTGPWLSQARARVAAT
jgi:hypothetical protein